MRGGIFAVSERRGPSIRYQIFLLHYYHIQSLERILLILLEISCVIVSIFSGVYTG